MWLAMVCLFLKRHVGERLYLTKAALFAFNLRSTAFPEPKSTLPTEEPVAPLQDIPQQETKEEPALPENVIPPPQPQKTNDDGEVKPQESHPEAASSAVAEPKQSAKAEPPIPADKGKAEPPKPVAAEKKAAAAVPALKRKAPEVALPPAKKAPSTVSATSTAATTTAE